MCSTALPVNSTPGTDGLPGEAGVISGSPVQGLALSSGSTKLPCWCSVIVTVWPGAADAGTAKPTNPAAAIKATKHTCRFMILPYRQHRPRTPARHATGEAAADSAASVLPNPALVNRHEPADSTRLRRPQMEPVPTLARAFVGPYRGLAV